MWEDVGIVRISPRHLRKKSRENLFKFSRQPTHFIFGFSMAKKKPSSGESPATQLSFEEEKEKFMGMISDELAKRDFKSPEEANEFLNKAFTGQTMGHSLAEWDTRPPGKLDEARDILNRVSDDARGVTGRSYAKKALKVTEDCMEAWDMLAWSYQSFRKIEENLLKGIAHGRRLHANLISMIDGEHGLWGHHECRPFMRLFESLAELYSLEGMGEKEMEILEQMIALNPGDNQGVRGCLLNKYLQMNRLDDAEILLARYPDDIDLGIVYGRVLLELVKILNSDFDFEQLERKMKGRPLMLASFGQPFAKAKRLMKEAIKANPFVPLLMSHPTSLYREAPGMFQFRSPDQAMIFIHDHAIDWLGSLIGWIFMEAHFKQAAVEAKKLPLPMQEAFDQLLDELDEIEQDPWQDIILKQGAKPQ